MYYAAHQFKWCRSWSICLNPDGHKKRRSSPSWTLRNYDRGVVVDVTAAGLSISETRMTSRSFHTPQHLIPNGVTNIKTFRKHQFCSWKRMAWLLWADRKATVTQITHCGGQNSISTDLDHTGSNSLEPRAGIRGQIRQGRNQTKQLKIG